MAVEIKVPALGESIVDAVIARWLKKEGDTIEQDDLLVELETDKVNVEVPAQQSGVLQKITKQEGDTVAVGEVLGLIGDNSATTSPPGSATTPVMVAAVAPPAQAVAVATSAEGQRAATPVAQRIASEHNLDLAQVKSSGPQGRITKDDVLSHMQQSPPPAATPAPAPPPVSVPTTTSNGNSSTTSAVPSKSAPVSVPSNVPTQGREERVRLSRRRQTIAQRLVEAQHNAAMLTTFNEVDMSAIMAIRSRRKDAFKQRHEISLGFMSFFTKAVVGALKAFPRLNAEIQGNEMILKHYYDIGIAVGAEEGLVVPVLREADRKNFAEIEREIADLATRVRNNTLTLTDLQGGTFTITNGGVFGSLLSTPILNAPQVGILGMHKIEERPVAINKQVEIRPMMYLALSYDHRIVDGREAVQFLVRVKELIEDPENLLLEG